MSQSMKCPWCGRTKLNTEACFCPATVRINELEERFSRTIGVWRDEEEIWKDEALTLHRYTLALQRIREEIPSRTWAEIQYFIDETLNPIHPEQR